MCAPGRFRPVAEQASPRNRDFDAVAKSGRKDGSPGREGAGRPQASRPATLWAVEKLGRTLLILLILLGGPLAAFAQTDVSVDLEQFGVGGAFRPGGVAGIRVQLTSTGPAGAAGKNYWVQWQVPNADGDIAECGRSVALASGGSGFFWLYGWLPPETNASSVWTVRVFEEKDGVRGAETGGTRVGPTSGKSGGNVIEPEDALIGVIGERRLGLDDYSRNTINRGHPIFANENTAVASGMKPDQLPDRWYGLSQFEALVWAGDASPSGLGLSQSEAIREWVRRGGHLVVVLPAAGNSWGMGVEAANLLSDLLPCRTRGMTPRLDEGVKLESLLTTLSKYDKVSSTMREQPTFPIRVFRDFANGFDVGLAKDRYEPLISLPDGRVIAVQRWFGFGRVTVIGVDLVDGRFNSLGLPQADAFWNRILGRRCDTPTNDELRALENASRLNPRAESRDNAMGSGQLILGPGGISMSGDAGLGLLAAVVLFGAYFLCASPLGFAVLKHYGVERHSWLVFAALSAAFTALAWGVVQALPKSSGISHITILDHVARPAGDPRPEEPQYQRAVSYFSAYLPRYGKTRVAVASDKDQQDVLASWTPPGPPPTRFPNVDQYRIDVARQPGAYEIPSRATSTQLYAQWMGGLDPAWGGMLQEDPNDPIRVEYGADGQETQLKGTIINNLPGELRDWTVIWVKNRRPPRRHYDVVDDKLQPWPAAAGAAAPSSIGSAYRWDAARGKNPFQASAKIALSTDLQAPASMQGYVTRHYVEPFVGRDNYMSNAATPTVSEDDRRRYLEMMTIFGLLDPPTYLKSPNNSGEDTVAFHRQLGRELDLSPWLTRPCLIVIGYIEKSAVPTPLRLGGDNSPPTGEGLTMVRWIYPLPFKEEAAFEDVFARLKAEGPAPASMPAATAPKTPPVR